MPDKSPRIPSIFRNGAHVSPAARGSGEGNRLVTRVDHPASDLAELSSSRRKLRAITSNSFPWSRPPARPIARPISSHTLPSSDPPCIPSTEALFFSPRPLDTRSPVRVFTRVLEFCQYHTSRPPNKSIPPHPVRGTFGRCTT